MGIVVCVREQINGGNGTEFFSRLVSTYMKKKNYFAAIKHFL